MRRHVRWYIVSAILLTVGCGPSEGGLQGSMGDFYDLEYSTVRARLYEETLSVEFVRTDSQVPVRVTVVGPSAGEHDILEDGDVTGRVGHQVLPPVVGGRLELVSFEPREDEQVAGSFDARFDVGEKTASLSGRFDAPLEIVDEIEGYDYSPGGAP